MSGRIIFVEDSTTRVTETVGLIGQLQRTHSIVKPTVWDPVGALQRITGGGNIWTSPKPGAEVWDHDDWLFLDCWDRDALDEPATDRTRSAFFALDLLVALRSAGEAGCAVPRVVAHSRGMGDDMVRAALSEFLHPRHQPVPGRGKPWRVATGGGPGVLWAMFDRTSMEMHLGDILLSGDRSHSLGAPPPGSAVWDLAGPTSCLASFHCEVRDSVPQAWHDNVVGAAEKMHASEADQKRIRRIAETYLDVPPGGAKGYVALLHLARAIANPYA